MERTRKNQLKHAKELPIENGDPSDGSDNESPEEIDTHERFVAELKRTTAGTVQKQLKTQAKKFYKEQIAKVRKEDWSSNLDACAFVDQRTGERCPHKACPADDRFWFTGKFKPKRYHGKLCKKHWQTTKQQLMKQGVDLTDESTWNETKPPSSTFASRVNTPRYHSTPSRSKSVASSVQTSARSGSVTPARQSIKKEKPSCAKQLFRSTPEPVEYVDLEMEELIELPTVSSVSKRDGKTDVASRQKQARQSKVFEARGIPKVPTSEKDLREAAEHSDPQSVSNELQREQDAALALKLETIGINVDTSHLNGGSETVNDPKQDLKRLAEKEKELGLTLDDLLLSEKEDLEKDEVVVVSDSDTVKEDDLKAKSKDEDAESGNESENSNMSVE